MLTGLENPVHLIFLLLLLLLLFGAKRLPEIGRSLGTGLREFKQSITSEAPPAALAPGASQDSKTAASEAPDAARSERHAEMP